MLSKRSEQDELIDDLEFNNPVLVENLKEMELLNKYLGYNKALVEAMEIIYKRYRFILDDRAISIVDLGCGGGDALRCIYDWSMRKSIDCDLLGIDANSLALEYARNISLSYPEIQYKIGDILSNKDRKDVVILNNVCHHFSDPELVDIFKNLKNSTNLVIVINDIHRNILAYFGIKIVTKILKFSYLAKNDAPLSVLKGFIKKDFCELLNLAGVSNFEIRWIWPFRWQVIVDCA